MANRHANKTEGIRMQVGTLRPSPGKPEDSGSIVGLVLGEQAAWSRAALGCWHWRTSEETAQDRVPGQHMGHFPCKNEIQI